MGFQSSTPDFFRKKHKILEKTRLRPGIFRNSQVRWVPCRKQIVKILLLQLSGNDRFPNCWKLQLFRAPKISKNLAEVHKLPQIGVKVPMHLHGFDSWWRTPNGLRLAPGCCLHLLHEAAHRSSKSRWILPQLIAVCERVYTQHIIHTTCIVWFIY